MPKLNVTHHQLIDAISKWLSSQDVFITDKDGNVLPDAIIDCKPGTSLIDKLKDEIIDTGYQNETLVIQNERLKEEVTSLNNYINAHL